MFQWRDKYKHRPQLDYSFVPSKFLIYTSPFSFLTLMSCLFAFPEELIETVLSYCVVSSSTSRSPTYHGPQSNSHIRSRVAILLACKSFYRIGAPLFYHTISIQSSRQLRHLLAAAIRPNLRLATYIRQIIMSGIWAEAGELFYHCRHNLKFLDLTLDSILNTQGHEPNTEEFCKGLYELKRLSHIVVRKPNNVYLTRPKLQYVLSEMARAMYNWDDLVCHSWDISEISPNFIIYPGIC